MTLPVPLFGRRVLVQIGDLQIQDLRVSFSIEKSLNKHPNRADIKVYNISPSHRALIERSDIQDVILLAGYEKHPEQIFVGQLARVIHYNDGTDWITHLRAGDGLDAVRVPGSAVSATNTTAKEQIDKAVDKMGLGKGNFDRYMVGRDPKKMKRFASVKSTWDNLTSLAAALQAEVSIQDGAIQMLDPGKISDVEIVELSARTGMIGSPDLGKKGLTKVRCLIQQKLTPGRGVSLAAKECQGIFRIESVHFHGDTHELPWYADLELNETVVKT